MRSSAASRLSRAAPAPVPMALPVFVPEKLPENILLLDRAALSLDGGESLKVMEGDIITITRSDCEAQFIRIKNDPFFEILNRKLAGTEASRS